MIRSAPGRKAIDLTARREFAQLLDDHLKRGQRPSIAQNRWKPWTNHDFAAATSASPNSVANWRNQITPIPPRDIRPLLDALFDGKPEFAGHNKSLKEAWERAQGLVPGEVREEESSSNLPAKEGSFAATERNVREQASLSARTRFAKTMAKQLAAGVRPEGHRGIPWTYADFAYSVQSSRTDASVSPRSVSNWCKGRSLPTKIEPILDALFGPREEVERFILLGIFRDARAEASADAIKRAKPHPGGAVWVARGLQLVIDRTAHRTDARVAGDPLQQQLQAEIRDVAASLAKATSQRSSNALLIGKVSATAAAISALLNCDPKQLLDRLGRLYRHSLMLGEFLNVDMAIRADNSDAPLDADLRGDLSVLVRICAPWLRSFPSIMALDNKAASMQFLGPLVAPALGVIQCAQDHQVIPAEDASDVVLALSASHTNEFRSVHASYYGRKAANLGVADTLNLVLTAVRKVGTAQSGISPNSADENTLVRGLSETLLASRLQAATLANTMPPDLQHAVNAVIEDVELKASRGAASSRVTALLDQPSPDDIESEARTMILNGHPPPAAWRPLIHRLDLSARSLDSLSSLSGLTALQHLNLIGTAVSDVSPLSGLTALQFLDLTGTRVNDLSPLSGLTALQVLNLNHTQVSDLSPLSGLTAMKSLQLIGTTVSDLSPLSGLTALQNLNLAGGERVSDLSPLARLTALETLNLTGMRLSDVSLLSDLTALLSLNLTDTGVSDVSPLARLTGLTSLDLTRTRVSDVSPLALRIPLILNAHSVRS